MIHNLVVFHGSDHKVGTTMIAQSAAETITANQPNLKLLFIAMNGRESTEYTKENPAGIDSLKFHIDNKMISGRDFMKMCTHKGNYYMMAGISNEFEVRSYHPNMAKYLLDEITPEFDLVIVDSGNELDNGLAVGALTTSDGIYYITAQQESALKRYEKNLGVLKDLGLSITKYIVNKYEEQDPYGLTYISNRLEVEKEKIMKIDLSGGARQAEINSKTLLEYKNEAYCRDITDVANEILNHCGFAAIQRQRKSRWKSFI